MKPNKLISVTCQGNAWLRPDELVEFQGDLKTLSERSYQKLRAAIADPKIGFSFPIFVWRNKKKNYIIDGHQRLITVRRMIKEGYTLEGGKLPVDWIEAPDIKTAKKKVILAVSQYGAYNEDSFSEFLKTAELDFNDLKDMIDLPQIDLEQFAIDWEKDFGEGTEDSERDNEVPPIPEIPKTRSGELWLLEKHRLLCADSTNEANLTRLIGEGKIDIVFTDPPYGLNIVRGIKKGVGTTGGGGLPCFGRVRQPGRRPKGIVGSKGMVKPRLYYPIIGDDKPFDPTFLLNLGPICLIFGANNFSSRLPDSPGWIIWDKEVAPDSTFSKCELIWSNVKKHITKYNHRWTGMCRAGNRNEELMNRVHPTQKPVGLLCDILADYKGLIVIDPFLGSGTTLIACEKIGRICYGMEIDPHYCDVILDRWANYTGKDPVREDGVKWSELKEAPIAKSKRVRRKNPKGRVAGHLETPG